jgi:hypothetical protein
MYNLKNYSSRPKLTLQNNNDVVEVFDNAYDWPMILIINGLKDKFHYIVKYTENK